MLIYACDDEIFALGMIEDTIKEVVPEAVLKTFNRATDLFKEIEKEVPDIVFTDIKMPNMTGIDLARRIKELGEKINIIFVTGYGNYATDALNLFASGYVMKPIDKEHLEEQLSNLRYPILEKKDIVIKTFGYFTIFYKDKPIVFRLQKSKELLAVLTEQMGNSLTRKEIASYLFEDSNYSRNEQKNLSKIIRELLEDLEKIGIKDLVINQDSNLHINIDLVSCDLYDYINKKEDVKYNGKYMEQYPWSETYKWKLDDLKQ